MHSKEGVLHQADMIEHGLSRKAGGEYAKRLPLTVREVKVAGRVSRGGGHQHITVVADKLLPEYREIAGGAHHLIHRFKQGIVVAACDGIHHSSGSLPSRTANGARHQLGGDGQTCACAQLQQTDGITHTALCLASDKASGLLAQVDSLLAGDQMQAGGKIRHGDTAEIKALTARNNGCRKLLQLGGCQNKDDVLGRLLQRFKQGVERAGGEHMHLVDDIHAVAQLRGAIDDLVANIADIVYTVVGGGIHFQNVGRATRINAAAGGANATRAGLSGVLTVDRLGKDLSAGGLARSARAAEQVGMGELPCRTFILQDGRDMVLSHDLIKIARPPLAVECLVHSLRFSSLIKST